MSNQLNRRRADKTHIVVIDYPAIGEVRFLGWNGQLHAEYPNARQFTLKDAQRAAKSLGPNARVESTQTEAG